MFHRGWKTALILFVVEALTNAALADTRWAIVTKPSPEVIPAGEFEVVGGATAPQGVHLALTELTIENPVQVTLASTNGKTELELLIFKDSPTQPLFQGATGADGVLTQRFRTAEEIDFLVRGPEGAQYQFLAWVGPRIRKGIPAAFVSMDEFLGGTGSEAADTTRQPTAATTPPAAESPMMKWIVALLALILAALVAIAILLLRRATGKAAGVILLAGLSGTGVAAQIDLSPKIVPDSKWKRDISREINRLREHLEDIEGNTNVTLKPGKDVEISVDPVGDLKLVIAFLEQFGIIDPREEFVQAVYDPPGIPPLPSRCYGTSRCGECFDNANHQLTLTRRHLENNYVAYRQLMLEVQRLTELADAAAGLHPIAQLKWTLDKSNPNDPMNKSKVAFFKKYDTGQNNGIDALNEALIAMGQCENEQFGDPSWYARYGMPYYMFMRERYIRRE